MSPHPNAVFSAFSFFGSVLCVIPLAWQLQTWNVGTCLFLLWSCFGCLTYGINSIIWANDAINRAPVWCDITTKLLIGMNVGIPTANLLMNRRLYYIARLHSTPITDASRRRIFVFDLSIGIGIPVIEMVFHYIVQGHRFNILGEIGCLATTYVTPPAIVLVEMWPAVLAIISFVYGALSLIQFQKRRAFISQLSSQHKNLTASRYTRLQIQALTEMIFTVPLTSFLLYANTTHVFPWRGWADTKYDFSRVDSIPAVLWRSNKSANAIQELCRWLPILCAFVSFAIFGFAEEARIKYRAAYRRVASFVLRRRPLEDCHHADEKSPNVTFTVELGSGMPTSFASSYSETDTRTVDSTEDEKKNISNV